MAPDTILRQYVSVIFVYGATGDGSTCCCNAENLPSFQWAVCRLEQLTLDPVIYINSGVGLCFQRGDDGRARSIDESDRLWPIVSMLLLELFLRNDFDLQNGLVSEIVDRSTGFNNSRRGHPDLFCFYGILMAGWRWYCTPASSWLVWLIGEEWWSV